MIPRTALLLILTLIPAFAAKDKEKEKATNNFPRVNTLIF